MKGICLFVAITLACVLQPVVAQARPPVSSVTIGVDVDAGAIDPRLAQDSTAARTSELIFAGLVFLDHNMVPRPDLAESWTMPDPLTWVFTLRPGLAFSDGTPLTADDVVYTFSTIADPGFHAPRYPLFEPIAEVKALDERRVQFRLKHPYAPLLSYLSLGIVSRQHAQNAPGGDAGLIGAGPMVLVERNPGQSLTFARNPQYWATPCSFEHIVLQVVGPQQAAGDMLTSGKVDIIQSPLTPFDIHALSADPRFGHAETAGLGITYLNFNVSDPLIGDRALRHALAHFIDQKTIVEQIYQGVDALATSVLAPSSWAYSADVKQPSFDIEKGLRELAELGWTDSDGDGILDKDGHNLTFTLATHPEDPNRVQTLVFLQGVMQSAGIDARIRILPWNEFSKDYVYKSRHQIALMGWLNIIDPDRLLFAQLTTGGALNYGKYSNPQFDRLLIAARSTEDRDERARLYQSAARIIANELPYYVISAQGYQMIYRKDLAPYLQTSPSGGIRDMLKIEPHEG